MKLFEDSDSENEDLSKIEIDKEYARRYDHNKKREDLQRYEELEKRGLVPRRLRAVDGEDEDSEESSSSDDDDDDDDDNVISVHSKKKDLEFFENLLKVRKKDPALKSKDAKLFDSESDEEDGGGNEKSKKKKGVFLKDLAEKHLIEDGSEFGHSVNDSVKKLAYNDEQEEIRKAFLEAAEGDGDDDDDDDLLMEKVKKGDERNESDDEELRKKVGEYFDEELDENANFLKEYFLKKMWVDKRKAEVDEEELEILSEDDKEVEKQEEYEYRFQENAGDQVLGHARVVEGTVRKKVKARKEQRKHKEERMEIARLEREDELRHLKNLKKKEMDERIKRIMASAGIDDEEVVPLSAKELEQEFDPEEYDRMMRKAFGDKYYEAEDVDPEFGSDEDEDDGLEKPDFDKEDELLGLPKGWDGRETGDGFLAARERSLKHKVENDSDKEEEEEEEEEDDDEQEEEEEEEVTEEVKRKRKRKSAILEKAKEAMLEEYYKLDYEDTIGDLKTRFRYAKIKPNRYGLSTDELLTLDDKELNQYVSLKKIAPYKDKEWKVPNSKRFEMKVKARDALHNRKPIEHKFGKKKRKREIDANEPSSLNIAFESGKAATSEASNLSRNARRRQQKAELKLSQSRLAAYGKVESKSKKKEKH